MHDFILLPEYYIVHMTPFVTVSSWINFKIAAGWSSPGEGMKHYSDKPSKFVLIPRDPAKSDQIITVDTGRFQVSLTHYFCICIFSLLLCFSSFNF